MFDVDYFLYGVFVAGLVAVYGIWSFNQREITIRRLEEDRKDARQDIAKEQMKQMKQMQYQHELDLQKLEMQISNGDSQIADLMRLVLPMVINKGGDVLQNADSASAESAPSSMEEKEQTENEERDAEPAPEQKTELRKFVDSEAGDAFFHRYQNLLNK